jgi:hypothetical protein
VASIWTRRHILYPTMPVDTRSALVKL